MLTSLSIKNFALIEKLEINFSENFSIITGETGAGKSILLGALGLVLGKRADLGSLKNKEEKCVVEAQFDIAAYNLQTFFIDNDLDFEPQTVIRREILPSGKSRAFVNDSPVNLQQLQELGDFLIDIHSQQQTRELSEENYQFEIIDTIAQNKLQLADYQIHLKKHKKLKSQLIDLQNQLANSTKEQDYKAFLLNELQSAKLVSGEQQLLETQFEELNNVEVIRENLDKAIAIAQEEQFGILTHLSEVKNAIQKIANFSGKYQQLSERINSVSIEFTDIVQEIDQLSANLFGDPESLELTNQKLQLIYTLQKKHQLNSVEELLELQEKLESEVHSVENLQTEIDAIEKEIENSAQKLDELAIQLHKRREAAVPELVQQLIDILALLGMPDVRFQIQFSLEKNYFENGKDTISLQFTANKGIALGPLKKTASGGEMSRIMLAVKATLAKYQKLPTIIFDEIDTGVSGEIAIKMGEIMKQMSHTMQVFAITHLPQIAAKGTAHFKVFKTTEENQTTSELILLSAEERVAEIAQMLSGKDISDSAINHARALLN
ncbi:DNA repair protein RecN [Flavobacterium sp. NST-5]|uniref:DNA repair protein RecN n=1 Tax=Flavobacterium ichthyis TaxID=2698827 RepID=A0ABW9Z904_9FLAO|nr:DNA repair protein RecN [Flavobacterium ichthyis]NBL64279.1 DNA repair protein RecN [Flavobacterium ichthyis]